MDAASTEEAKRLATEGLTAAAKAMGLPVTDPAVIAAVADVVNRGIEALSGRVYRQIEAQARAKAAEIKTVEDAERSRQERLKDK